MVRVLPRNIAWRKKSKFAVGAGLGDQLARFAGREISDADFAREREIAAGRQLRSKEERYYFRIFRQMFPQPEMLAMVGTSRSV